MCHTCPSCANTGSLVRRNLRVLAERDVVLAREEERGLLAGVEAGDALLEDHAHDAEHGRAAVLELLVELLGEHLRVGRKVSAEVASAVVARVVGGGPDGDLEGRDDEEEDLEPAEGRHVREGGHARRDVLGGEAALEGAAAEDGVAVGHEDVVELVHLRDEVAHHGGHADAAVLDLDRTAALEAGLVLREAEGVPEAERREHAELVLNGHAHRALGRGTGLEGRGVERQGGHEDLSEHG
mmetsp:Transcript_9975/g.33870  ORF Transcript_9975/g.33870 Transcript_9975/m.33870 type:complete len:240 (+) Transcript_9975:418-1137(+)